MKRRQFLGYTLFGSLLLSHRLRAFGGTHPFATPVERLPDGKPHAFTLHAEGFQLDGQPFQIRSGEMHPARIPRAHWLHRIRMAKAMGLNTIALYLMWNYLEGEPGQFDFSSERRDVVAFIKLCQQEGMWVYLRPGPYVCAEWDLGGLPSYLLRTPGIKLRDGQDATYMQAVSRYVAEVAARVAPLMAANGGPILMLQVENEYASFAGDTAYLEKLRDLWQQHGIEGPFSIADVLSDQERRHPYLPGAALGLDGAKPPELRKGHALAPQAPVWVAEGYPGWLTHWGEPDFARKDYHQTLSSLIAAGYSFSLYMVHGGTNFGLTAGANADDDGSNFQPVITSYDYSAPINERGDATPAYHQLRRILARTSHAPLPEIPAPCPRGQFAAVIPQPVASLWDVLPDHAVTTQVPQANEILLQQNQGMVVYRKRLTKGGQLHVHGVNDYACVHVDGVEHGLVSRMHDKRLKSTSQITLPERDGMQLDILVDSFGHINYGPPLGDHKGLVGDVSLDSHPLHDWEVFALPVDDALAARVKPGNAPDKRPGQFFSATLQLSALGDVYVDLHGWNKGYVWINGHLLGRYWHLGPQYALYCPAEWLQSGDNQLLILDLHQTKATLVRCADSLAGHRA